MSPSAPEPATPTAEPGARFTTTLENVEYRLVEAGFESGELRFWFIATNSGADKDVCLRFSSSLIDLGGNRERQAGRDLDGDATVDTVGGLVVQAFGRVPKRGETTQLDSLRFRVVRADSRRIHTLQVERIDAPPTPPLSPTSS